ncbi:MAG TPA: restriction endonuclease subunit S, partial [Flavobacterium sp.]|nr:restriction endonuclease subunit S [Flavobacterium sp.]
IFIPDRLWQTIINQKLCVSRWLSYFLITEKVRDNLKSIATGTSGSMKNISKPNFLSITVSIPTLPEQQKIASFLSAVDEKTQQLSRKKELLEQYKKGVMQQLFSGKLRFKDENGKDYPDWEEKKLGEVAEKRIIKNKENKINLVFTNSAMQGIVNQRDYFDKDIANQNNLLGYYIVENNDFVYNPRISTNAPVGPISRNYLETGIMSPLYSVFRFKYGNLDFIEYFFNSVVWHKHMKDISNYGARDDRMSFSTNDFYKMPIPFPSLKEQQKIADFLSSIDVKIDGVNQQLVQMQTFKKGLLQQMFV